MVEALRDAHAAEGRRTWHPTLHRGTDSELCLLYEAVMPVGIGRNESCVTTLTAMMSTRREVRRRKKKLIARGGDAQDPWSRGPLSIDAIR